MLAYYQIVDIVNKCSLLWLILVHVGLDSSWAIQATGSDQGRPRVIGVLPGILVSG